MCPSSPFIYTTTAFRRTASHARTHTHTYTRASRGPCQRGSPFVCAGSWLCIPSVPSHHAPPPPPPPPPSLIASPVRPTGGPGQHRRRRDSGAAHSEMASCVNSTLNNLLTSYKNWIVANPQILTDIEATVRCLSYFSFGHLRNSTLASELIYSMPNLIVLCNDLLMYNGRRQHLKIPQFDSKIKIWLTVVEYTETLLEVSAKKLWGPKGKWLIIVVIQLFKSILRLILVHIYKERVTKSPATPPLNREKFNKAVNNVQLKEGFTLKRSGTVVRSVKYSAPIEVRTWKALPSITDENENLTLNQESERNLKLAESLYVTKPLLHLGCMYITNQKHWPPWILSLIIDLASLNVFTRCSKKALFSKDEEEELVRRRLSLLLYILRSPFYDKYSRNKINALLGTLSTSVPFAKYLTSAVQKNLPYMQNMYFYMWSR